jgi:serine/threonine protein kinase
MESKNWKKLEEAVSIAVEISDTQKRAAWLTEFCAGDEELKSEIESLLAFEMEAANFLENSLAPYAAKILPETENNLSGKQFGHYKIIREIGYGGMGAVFLAMRDDGEFEQQVAIKIIRQTIAESEIINRFKRERQILATLNHPNIAKLLDGGVSEDGLPFLAMEFIDGETITKFVEREKLNLEDRLKLFLKVCSAVSYAHRNLIVHRDLKPSNILVTKDNEPKLLDFGLAKLIDENLSNDTQQTQTAFRALTPAYASPEQLKGEPLTTSSDIYSLGIVFYELLTGERPFHFEGKSLEEIIKTASESEPTLPSVNPKSKIQNLKLSGDLDNIALMALRKEPERRYQSVEAFADDIERYLKGLPVSARPNTFKYLASKFIKRNKTGVFAASLILISLIGGIITTVWQARRAEAQRIKAEKRFNDVRKLATSNLFEIHPKIENLPGATEARELLLKRALEYLDSLSTEAGDDAELQSELAAAYEKVGDVQGRVNQPSLGDTDASLTSYRKAQIMRENLLAKDSDNIEKRSDLANNYQQIGFLLWWSSDTKGAVEFYEKSLAIWTQLVTENPNSFELRGKLANAKMLYGDIPAWDNETEKALSLYRSAADILQKLSEEQPDNLQIKSELARSHSRLADAYKGGGDLENAVSEAESSIKLYEPLIAAEPENYKSKRGLWIAYFRQCEIYLSEKDSTNASKVCRNLTPLAEILYKADPKDLIAQRDLAGSYYQMGETTALENKFDDALVNYNKSLEIITTKIQTASDKSDYESDLAENYIGIGKVERQLKRFDAAFENQKKAMELMEKVIKKDSESPAPRVFLASAYQEIGEIYLLRQNKPEAQKNFKSALEILQKLDEENALNSIDKKQIPELQSKISK